MSLQIPGPSDDSCNTGTCNTLICRFLHTALRLEEIEYLSFIELPKLWISMA